MALFPTERALLYPQFETYRLHSLDPDEDVVLYRLPGEGATQSRVGYNKHTLTYKEVKARIGWNHLCVQGRRGVYVDAEWNIVGFELAVSGLSLSSWRFADGSQADMSVTFSQLGSLPVPISTTQSSTGGTDVQQQSDYPSVLILSSTHWAVSTGSGSLYILQTSDLASPAFTGELTARYDLTLPGSTEPVPFLLQACHTVSNTDVRLLLSRTVPPEGKEKRKSPGPPSFELIEIGLNPTARTDVDDAQAVSPSIKWTLRGGDLPLWCGWENEGWMILSEETFKPVNPSEETAQEHQLEGDVPGSAGARPQRSGRSSPDASRPKKVSKLGLGAKSAAAHRADPPAIEEAAPSPPSVDNDRWPFSWTQTGDSITMTIPFPAGTDRSEVTVDLKSTTLALSLDPARLATAPAPLQTFLARPQRTFWAEIDLHSTTFTFNPKTSVMTFEIAKTGDNNRWPAIFLPADGDDEDDEEEEVPETISAETMAAVRQTFSQIKTRDGASSADGQEPAGNHPALPALLREEMDFDMDDDEDWGEAPEGMSSDLGGGKIGREVFVGYIVDGVPKWSKSSATVLSTPLVSNGSNSVITKSAVDGTVFAPRAGTDPSKDAWQHIATNPALAFVLSSKRELRMVRHITAGQRSGSQDRACATVLAFDAGSSQTGQGNVYMYYPPADETSGRQGVVRVSGGDRGAVLGAGCLTLGPVGTGHGGGGGGDNDEDAIKAVPVVLCEKELVLLRNVLL